LIVNFDDVSGADMSSLLTVLQPGGGSADATPLNNSIIYGGVLNSNGIVPNAEVQALIENLESGSSVVPEPASLVLAGLGLLAVLLFMLRPRST
jgi:hypothetical protein